MEDIMKYLAKRKMVKVKRSIAFILVLTFLMSIPVVNGSSVFDFIEGDSIFVASQENIDEAQDELDDINDQMDEWEEYMDELESKLSDKAKVLSDLLMDKEILENDMAKTQTAIDKAAIDLEDAKKEEADAYEKMKIRIRFMYENSTQDTIWDAIIHANGITDLLNRVEYVSQVHNADRELLNNYKAIVQEVETLAAELESNMNDLVALQEIYERQEHELETAMAELEAEVGDYEEQIAAAKERAEELADYIEEENRKLEEERRDDDDDDDGGDDADDDDTAGGYLNDPKYDPPFTSGVDPQELVNYALQFVGNPYVWGGNSLTHGCDCSGFVNLIYRHFGFTGVPRYSQAFKEYGRPVAYANIKAGDIVVYPGHVAIYIGNGKIVEAQSSKAGITCNRRVNCNTITGIRRAL